MNAYDDPLYRECIPSRPSPADPFRMEDGPTEQARRLDLEREAWSILCLFDDGEAGAA